MSQSPSLLGVVVLRLAEAAKFTIDLDPHGQVLPFRFVVVKPDHTSLQHDRAIVQPPAAHAVDENGSHLVAP